MRAKTLSRPQDVFSACLRGVSDHVNFLIHVGTDYPITAEPPNGPGRGGNAWRRRSR